MKFQINFEKFDSFTLRTFIIISYCILGCLWMYSVLKSKRCHFEIPQKLNIDGDNQNLKDSPDFMQGSQKIVSSCFLDDQFILFLFNSGRYFIVDSNRSSKQLTQKANNMIKKVKKSKTVESQIVYQGNVIKEIQTEQQNTSESDSKEQKQSPQKLLSKTSLNFIEKSFSKEIFTECRRIKINECIILTRYSRNVYWLKVSKHSIGSIHETQVEVRTSIHELPKTTISSVLSVDKVQNIQSMTILTDFIQFDNTSEFSKESKGQKQTAISEKGSFCIKNEIFEDKMIYLTCYTRIPQTIRQKYSQMVIKPNSFQIQSIFPQFIVTKHYFATPLNEVSSNFIIEVSDKFNNEIAIYKQSQDDQNEWEIKLYRFGFQSIKGEQIVKKFTEQWKKKGDIYDRNQSIFGIENNFGVPKPIIITLPQQFNSSIHLQQFLKMDKSSSCSHESTYFIVSVNQSFAQNQQNQQDIPQNVRTVRINGQLFYLDENGALRVPQNTTSNNNCWIHLCRLTYHQNTESYSRNIERIHNFQINSLSFLKVINVNYQLGLMYVLSQAHQTVDGQLYENKIDLISLKSGQIVEKGYCSLKSYSVSPNQKYILDMPQSFTNESDFYYHIRILFDKKSLYIFMIENAKEQLEVYKDVNFIETVLSLL